MVENNPYKTSSAASTVDPRQRDWKGGADSVLAVRGLLQRRVIVNRPVEVTIEYFARGLRDRIIVDGTTVVSLVPVFWLHDRFDFEIPFRDGTLPATIRVKTAPRSIRLASFEIEINGVIAYCERDGHPQW